LLRQERVLLQPDDVAHAPALHALQYTGAAKARVRPHDNLRLGPGTAQRYQQPLDDPLEQQHAAVADDVAAIKRRFHHTAANTPELNNLIDTPWHRQSSVAIGVSVL